jgi:hypothetical protein
MQNNIIKIIVQSPNDYNWLNLLSVFGSLSLVGIGWLVSYYAERKKLRIEIEVRAAEEAINLLNEKGKDYTAINAPIYGLYMGFKDNRMKLKSNKSTEEMYSKILNVYRTAMNSLEEDRFSTYFESREIIFYNFRDKLNQLKEFRLNIFSECLLLYEDMVNNYFPKDRPYIEISREDTEELVKKLENFIRCFADLNNLIENLKIGLQNEFLLGLYKRKERKKRKLSEISLAQTYQMFDLPIINNEKEKVE